MVSKNYENPQFLYHQYHHSYVVELIISSEIKIGAPVFNASAIPSLGRNQQ
jgi:hypothetical protein